MPHDRLTNWVSTLGGPQILLPSSAKHLWEGADNWIDMDDASHYAQACRVADACLTQIKVANFPVFVFGGFVNDMTWIPSARDHLGDFVMPIGGNQDSQVLETLGDIQEREFEDEIIADLSESAWFLMDSAIPGNDPNLKGLGISLPARRLRFRSGYVNRGCSFLFWRVSLLPE